MDKQEKLNKKEQEVQQLEDEINLIEKRLEQGEKNLAESVRKSKELLRVSDGDIARVVDASIKQIDHIIDISKFFISLSATAIFAIYGIPNIISRNPLLVISLLTLLIFSITLFIYMKKRSKIIERYLDYYLPSGSRFGLIKSIYGPKS